MKKIVKIFSLFVITAILITACDMVEEPYLKPVDGGSGPGPDEHVRKVLLEDFTGHRCPNCPDGARIAHDLQVINGEQLIVVAIHAGFFAMPLGMMFTADYRTPAGNVLNGSFEINSYPSGLVNRKFYEGSRVLTSAKWGDAVDAQLSLPPQADIKITNQFNNDTRLLHCSLETTFLEDMEGEFNICLLITESGIISPQESNSGVIHDYVHNHMLRGYLNGTWGDPVGTNGQALSGVKQTNSYNFTVPASWDVDHCEVVAFVYHSITLEIIQAEQSYIINK